jgi:hypothetical protein
VIAAGLAVIAAAAVTGPRLGVASPSCWLRSAGFTPGFGSVHIEPELILEGVWIFSAFCGCPWAVLRDLALVRLGRCLSAIEQAACVHGNTG